MVQTFDTGLKDVAFNYLEILQAKVTESSIKKSIQENPYYPSLFSLSDTFNRYNISNKAFDVRRDNLNELAPPFVAYVHFPGIGKDFVLVNGKTDEKVTFLYKSRKQHSVSWESFLKLYQNVVWIAELSENSGEVDYLKNLQKEQTLKTRKLLLNAIYLGLLLFVILPNINIAYLWAYISILSLKLLGVTCAILLLIYELDNNNAFVKNICRINSDTNCNAVLGSKASKVFGISWSEVGFFYFSATTLWLLIPGLVLRDIKPWLVLTNSIALPYVLFSIFYQWRIVKQWCPLCLLVQGILLAECIWNIVNFWNSSIYFSFELQKFLKIAFCSIIPVTLWYTLKPLLIKAMDAESYQFAYQRLQYNPQIFDSILQQQPKAPDGWQNLGIHIGNPDARNIIIKVCNPFCGPCARAHPILENILFHNSNTKLIIIFKLSKSRNHLDATVAKHLLSVASENNPQKTQQSLDEWYLSDKQYYELFATKYPLTDQLELQNEKVEAMTKWCEAAEITHTPYIFVNSYKLPDSYKISELKDIL